MLKTEHFRKKNLMLIDHFLRIIAADGMLQEGTNREF
jgi:hypothetical protein